jgi:hypothetical protein
VNTVSFSRPIVVLAFIGALEAAFPRLLWAAERTAVERDLRHRGFKRCGSDPVVWNHKVPVPGLAHSAPPAFPQVDAFDGWMGIQNGSVRENFPRTPSSITPVYRDKTATGFGTAARSVQLGIAPGRSLYEQAVRDFDRFAWISNPALTREVWRHLEP